MAVNYSGKITMSGKTLSKGESATATGLTQDIIFESAGVWGAANGGNNSGIGSMVELEFFDAEDALVPYTMTATDAYLSATGGLPTQWNQAVWNNTNINNGNKNYVNNGTGSVAAYLNLYNISSPVTDDAEHPRMWSRFKISFASEEAAAGITRAHILSGNHELRYTMNFNIYALTAPYDKATMVDSNDNTGLRLAYKLHTEAAPGAPAYSVVYDVDMEPVGGVTPPPGDLIELELSNVTVGGLGAYKGYRSEFNTSRRGILVSNETEHTLGIFQSAISGGQYYLDFSLQGAHQREMLESIEINGVVLREEDVIAYIGYEGGTLWEWGLGLDSTINDALVISPAVQEIYVKFR